MDALPSKPCLGCGTSLPNPREKRSPMRCPPCREQRSRETQLAAYRKTRHDPVRLSKERERSRNRNKRVRDQDIGNHRIKERLWRLSKQYGISEERYNQLLEEQDYKCSICSKEFDTGVAQYRPYVDHCHKTGIVRGILCRDCNFALGLLKDSPEVLAKARLYLEKWVEAHGGGTIRGLRW